MNHEEVISMLGMGRNGKDGKRFVYISSYEHNRAQRNS